MPNKVASTKYRQPGQQGGSPRETEGRALMEAARRLAALKVNPGDPTAFADTVRLNWRLWTIFQSELSEPDNAIPQNLRANMLTLCNFVDKRTVEILADPQPRMLDALININRNVAAGLLASAAPTAPAASEAPSQPIPVSAGGFTA